MDYKEKILEKMKELLHPDYIVDDDILITEMKHFLASLPSEKEIAKGLIREYTDGVPNKNYKVYGFYNWLDEED